MPELNSLWVVIDGLLIIWCAHTAGTLRVALNLDEQEGRPRSWMLTGMWLANLAFAVYFVIALYGHGLERGGV